MASSDGWKFIIASGIQRRAPFTGLPTNGSSTTISSSKVPTKIHGDAFSHTETGTCTTISAATNAIAIEAAWRIRK